MDITTLHSIDTEYSADAIEWCPHLDYLSYFVCGTYQLEGDNSDSASPPCRRKGRIYLYKFDATTKELTEQHRLETAAILDMKWLPQSSKPILATANALGQVEVYDMEEDQLVLRSCVDLNPDYHNLLALSLDWDWQGNGDGETSSVRRIVASDSKGEVTLLNYTSEGVLEKCHSWSAHSFESWICSFDKWDRNRVFTGGDDSFLHFYDLRERCTVLTNKAHIAGVTCLLSHPKREHLLITGSYDERMRVFDTRSMKNKLGEIHLHGGVWRLKSDPLDRNLILAACMYKNFSVVRLSGENFGNTSLVAEFNEHKSICYGADWCLNVQEGDDSLYMATCSFYDHKLCISNIREK